MRPPDTFIGLPVRGFLPRRGFRRATEKVPKPTSVTGRPRLSEPWIPASSARSARSAATFVHPLAAAIEDTRSARVMTGYLSASAMLAPDGGTAAPRRPGDASKVALEGQGRNGIVWAR